jgi:hypothetical protein
MVTGKDVVMEVALRKEDAVMKQQILELEVDIRKQQQQQHQQRQVSSVSTENSLSVSE